MGFLLACFTAVGSSPTRAIPSECTEKSLLAAIRKANRTGGRITFECRDTTIRMRRGLGPIRSDVLLDGEENNVTLEYAGPFAGCSTGNNGVGGPPIAVLDGHDNTIRNLTFRHFLESIQIHGANNVIENNRFVAHDCSDDALSTLRATSRMNVVIRDNYFEGYRDKAIQMSYGSGRIDGNVFMDCEQPVRAPYDNSSGGPFHITDNKFTTSGDRDTCTGVTIDGDYTIHFERNTLQCFRGLRIGGKTRIVVRDNFIEGNARVGVRLGGASVASLSGNVVTNNGFEEGSLPAGGVVVWQGARADLGGGEVVIAGDSVVSAGRNVLRANAVANVRNLVAGYALKARNNCWDESARNTGGEVDAGAASCEGVPICGDGDCRRPENVLTCPDDCPPSCADGLRNGDETGRDCGGRCEPCPPDCFDGVRNGNEQGVDCGGDCRAACPTCTDGIMNGDETGVDCGGSCPNQECPSGVDIYLEAERGGVRSPAEIVEDARASGGRSVTSSRGDAGEVSLEIPIPEQGRYYFWVRVSTPTEENDAIWFGLDGEGKRKNRFFTGRPMNDYAWFRLHDRGDPYVRVLAAGSHTLTFRFAEIAFRLDRVFVTNEAAADPRRPAGALRRSHARPSDRIARRRGSFPD